MRKAGVYGFANFFWSKIHSVCKQKYLLWWLLAICVVVFIRLLTTSITVEQIDLRAEKEIYEKVFPYFLHPPVENCFAELHDAVSLDDLICQESYFPFHQKLRFHNVPGVLKHSIAGLTWEIEPSIAPIPIFILAKDRLTVLMEAIRSFHQYIKTPFEIVIHDENSTFPATVNFLKGLESQGVKVYWHQDFKNGTFEDTMDRLRQTIATHMKTSKAKAYIVTDPDIGLDAVSGDILFAYYEMLINLDLMVVGSAMRWDDWPPEIRKIRFELRFAKEKIHTYLYEHRPVPYIFFDVDTTFAMYKRETIFGRMLTPAVRVFPPFAARHLDFYWTKERMPEDMVYYLEKVKNKKITHMNHLAKE
jgi:hypothetical protein